MAASTPGFAAELVDRNPFDPHRKPWPSQPQRLPELPAVTAQDLQIEAIVSFGAFRGIIAQLDGRLRGTLPGNSAGKVRIGVGQSFGGGYVLESVAANQAVIQGGSARYTIPVVRKAIRGAVPAPATMAVEQRAALTAPTAPAAPPTPHSPPTPFTHPPGSAPGVAGAAPGAPAPPGAPGGAAVPLGSPAPPPQAPSVGAATPPQPAQQPMSLLEAIQAAQAAARNQQGSAPPVANPFTMPRK